MRHALAARLSAAALVGRRRPAPVAGPRRRARHVANPDGQAKIDPTYATTLTVSGSGFQSVKGGHGGIYVFFGTVKPGWQPSKGGATGEDYFYVPDSEAKDNQGFQRYVAFPGSDTAVLGQRRHHVGRRRAGRPASWCRARPSRPTTGPATCTPSTAARSPAA